MVWLAKGGDDTAENTVALCPNCHKKMHIVDDAKDVEVLKSSYCQMWCMEGHAVAC
ncbi:HNH endonuclease [Vibrio parahaemolyticus]